LLNSPSIILVLIFVNVKTLIIANVISRTSPCATYMVLAGDLVPAGTTLVTPGLECSPIVLYYCYTRVIRIQ